MFAEIGKTCFIHGEYPVFCAGLNRHVRDREAIVHRKRRDPRSGEFERLVSRAVNADLADQVQDEILAAHMAAERACELNTDRLRNTEPGLPRRHSARHIGRTDARRERAERTVCAGVAVRADDKIARRHQSLFGKKRVFHAAVVADLEIVLDLLAAGEVAHAGALCRRLHILVGREVVGDERDLRAVENAFASEFRKLANRYGRGDVVAENEIEIGHYEFTGMDVFLACMERQNLLAHRHS